MDGTGRRHKCGLSAASDEVVRLARANGGDAPLNARMAALVETDPRPRTAGLLRAVYKASEAYPATRARPTMR